MSHKQLDFQISCSTDFDKNRSSLSETPVATAQTKVLMRRFKAALRDPEHEFAESDVRRPTPVKSAAAPNFLAPPTSVLVHSVGCP